MQGQIVFIFILSAKQNPAIGHLCVLNGMFCVVAVVTRSFSPRN